MCEVIRTQPVSLGREGGNTEHGTEGGWYGGWYLGQRLDLVLLLAVPGLGLAHPGDGAVV